ncbi:hypothetical protein BDF20DRAFT_830954 [Mycotypha africana]|uniref:uncharacterized protein n=1 Tax=Mycotypha africana TaxID=64632 RepID=UPI002301B035|nr:uncharacterized protein BDF20DRAFT_830954 [Mycotypha africana]KAI8990862.1 hypothetical protein BDF20DRAFT_830954 [Mycotypha africana]
MLMTALPAKPGTDLASKLLLQDSQLKNMIIAEVVGKGIGGEAYYVGPLIVEIQQKVNQPFMARAIRYCLDIFEETTIVPILVVFNVKGFSGTQFLKETFTKADDQCFYTLYCHPWAKSVYIYNADSIAKHMSTPLQPIIALANFFTQQQRHLMTLDEFNDPTLHTIYRAAYTSFSKHCAQQSDQLKTMQEFCDAISLQFGKIIT